MTVINSSLAGVSTGHGYIIRDLSLGGYRNSGWVSSSLSSTSRTLSSHSLLAALLSQACFAGVVSAHSLSQTTVTSFNREFSTLPSGGGGLIPPTFAQHPPRLQGERRERGEGEGVEKGRGEEKGPPRVGWHPHVLNPEKYPELEASVLFKTNKLWNTQHEKQYLPAVSTGRVIKISKHSITTQICATCYWCYLTKLWALVYSFLNCLRPFSFILASCKPGFRPGLRLAFDFFCQKPGREPRQVRWFVRVCSVEKNPF